MSRCESITRRGLPCRFPARRGTTFCINHEPGANPEAAAANARAWRKRKAVEYFAGGICLLDRSGVHALIESTVRLLLAGRISESRASVVLRACGIASRNFEAKISDRYKGRGWDPEDYINEVADILWDVDNLIDGDGTTQGAPFLRRYPGDELERAKVVAGEPPDD